MTLWKVVKCSSSNDTLIYVVLPYSLLGHLQCCLKWYGIKGLKWCYLFKRQAMHKAKKLNNKLKER